jgi:tRNA nucleotidyltransferase (CCA-adding enzyme)
MKTYTVGGAVRDQLLGLNVTDRDYVVVGMTPRQMIEAGFKPVGADFPVFLHPKTHEEYALARTERKTGPGYKGFTFHAAPTVTLEEDLARRDLTINAMARDDAGHIIDPYGGQADLNHKLLRHVGDAFREDPVRILRTARFAARFAQMGFTVAGETMVLMREMVDAGEVDSLVAERVWQEVARGLAEATPSRMFEVLRECGALAHIAPEIDRLWGVPQSSAVHPEIDTGVHVMMVIDYAAQTNASLPVRFAALTHDLGKAVTPLQFLPRHPDYEVKSVELIDALCARLRVPAECRDLAVVVARWHGEIHNALGLSADKLLALLDGCDALRRPGRFVEVLDAAA